MYQTRLSNATLQTKGRRSRPRGPGISSISPLLYTQPVLHMYKNLTKAGFQVAQKTIECNPRSTCSPRTLMEQPHSDHTQGGHNDQVGSTEVCHPVPAGAWNLTLCSHTTTHSLDIGRDAGLRNFRESPSLLTLHTSASVQLPQPKLTTARAFAHRPCRVGSSREVP